MGKIKKNMEHKPTPETDAAEIIQVFMGIPDGRTGRVSIDFARKLERERDELKSDLEFRRDLYRLQTDTLDNMRKELDDLKNKLNT